MWTHSAPQCIMRLISLPRSAKLLARTEGETMARVDEAMVGRRGRRRRRVVGGGRGGSLS